MSVDHLYVFLEEMLSFFLLSCANSFYISSINLLSDRWLTNVFHGVIQSC
jgi:hypothetical protein